jgi:signal transduction histidine kinase
VRCGSIHILFGWLGIRSVLPTSSGTQKLWSVSAESKVKNVGFGFAGSLTGMCNSLAVTTPKIILLHEKADRNSISIRTDVDSGLPLITADRVQLQQVLMNLILNGIEAMKDAKGELTITSKRTDDGQLLISVSDSGIGLPVGEVDRIFEAFFTTKVQGTGMGLSISRRIVESHGGSLWACANTERGATFQFTLPTDVAAYSPSAA